MARMEHASPRAALIYQYATSERDRTLADALERLAELDGKEGSGLRLIRAGRSECQWMFNWRTRHPP